VKGDRVTQLPDGWLGWILPTVFVVGATVALAMGASYWATLAFAFLVAVVIAMSSVVRRRRSRRRVV
jgi:membrane protein implicated in regulation of membrane protease activity